MVEQKGENQTAIQQAENEIPYKWYELRHKAFMLSQLATAFTLYELNSNYIHADDIPFRLVSAGIFLLSSIADQKSTIRGLRANNKLEAMGEESPYKEHNFIIGDVNNERTFKKKAAAITAIGTAVSSLNIGYGIALGGFSLLATAGNRKATQRIERAIEITEEKSLEAESY